MDKDALPFIATGILAVILVVSITTTIALIREPRNNRND